MSMTGSEFDDSEMWRLPDLPDLPDVPADSADHTNPGVLNAGAADYVDTDAIGFPDGGSWARDEKPSEPEPFKNPARSDGEPEPPQERSGDRAASTPPVDPPVNDPPAPVPSPGGDDERALFERLAEEMRDLPDEAPSVAEVRFGGDHSTVVNLAHPDQALVERIAEIAPAGVPEGWIPIPTLTERMGEGFYVPDTESTLDVVARTADPRVRGARYMSPVEEIEIAVEGQQALESADAQAIAREAGCTGVDVALPLAVVIDYETNVKTTYYKGTNSQPSVYLYADEGDPDYKLMEQIADDIKDVLEVHGIDALDLMPQDIQIDSDTRGLHIAKPEFSRLTIPGPTLEPGQTLRYGEGEWSAYDTRIAEGSPALYSASMPGSVVVARGGSPAEGTQLRAESKSWEGPCRAVTLWNPHTREGAIIRLDPYASPRSNVNLIRAVYERVPALGVRGAVCHFFGERPDVSQPTNIRELSTLAVAHAYAQGLRPKRTLEPVDRVYLSTNDGSVRGSRGGVTITSHRPPRRRERV